MTEEVMPTGGEGDGVLLYYKYAPVPNVQALVQTYDSNCKSLGLLGRVRIAHDGVNVTIGGKMSALEKHIEVMREDNLFEGTDFKLARCDGPSDEEIAKECGFTSLSVRVVKELVTFKSNPLLKSPSISNAGKHLSATEFHSFLHTAGTKLDSDGSPLQKKIVLLDARNVYETRIGMFQTPEVETMNPETRQYSDLPGWIDENSHRIQGKHVLMYCTGGIRCEMASAYIRSKGAGYENVYQLYGGIQRYLEQFPNGGYFKGKNFVFDHRISVGSKSIDIIGSCILCGSSFDNYSARCRCIYCRMLVLVCDSCQGASRAVYVCEICQKHGKKRGLELLENDGSNLLSSSDFAMDTEVDSVTNSISINSLHEVPAKNDTGLPRKLKILCLHGFRQNASSFKGRTASLAKKLRNIAEFIFIDAPHELPFIYQQQTRIGNPTSSSSSSESRSLPQNGCRKRFAWLVSSTSDHNEVAPEWKIADQPFDPDQYQQQIDGLEESYAYLEKIFYHKGPFDGILGFSQGAAMVALVCDQQQRKAAIPNFKFAILCSGFSLFPQGRRSRPISIPSLHVFGSSTGRDRQIDCKVSRKLASSFDEGCSMVVEHDMGHIIPTKPPYINQIREFLRRFI